jgi:hypothetical protein
MTQNPKAKIFAPSKVAIHQDRVDAYLRGEHIHPVTLELDLTQRCTRACPSCPYTVARSAGLTLELPFLDRLFSILGKNTPGLVLSGGEPTLVPHFPETVALAKEKGFKEVVVISNGSMLHLPRVQDALLEHATSIRVSLYDWQDGDSAYFIETLKKIRNLRSRIEKEGSNLEIGASILTRTEWNHKYSHVGMAALDAGVHWVYFHPFCIAWDKKRPLQADQTGVLAAIGEFQKQAPPDANIQVPLERYSSVPLRFSRLHGGHFLIQIGADSCNYAGPECKYQKDYMLLDLNEYLEDDFLWHPQRLERLAGMNSNNYRPVATKHRPPIFSDYIEKVMDTNKTNDKSVMNEKQPEFSYPEII